MLPEPSKADIYKVIPTSNSTYPGGFEIPADEEFLAVNIQLSVGKALKSPERKFWLEAIDREKLKLKASNTWRSLSSEEARNAKDVVPLAVLLTRKRDGKYKARAVVLGDRIDKAGMDLFAPTLSMPAHRMLLVDTARDGNYLVAFDIDCAFLHASLNDNEQINILLPAEWREANEKPVKRLLKALYGLPQAPQRWYQHYAKVLTTLGWEVCGHEKAMWRKASNVHKGKYLKLSIYVGDNILAGPDESETSAHVNQILAKLAGRIIEPEQRDD